MSHVIVVHAHIHTHSLHTDTHTLEHKIVAFYYKNKNPSIAGEETKSSTRVPLFLCSLSYTHSLYFPKARSLSLSLPLSLRGRCVACSWGTKHAKTQTVARTSFKRKDRKQVSRVLPAIKKFNGLRAKVCNRKCFSNLVKNWSVCSVPKVKSLQMLTNKSNWISQYNCCNTSLKYINIYINIFIYSIQFWCCHCSRYFVLIITSFWKIWWILIE